MNRALRAATIGALLLTPVALSACSAGQLNQTSAQARDKVGPSAEVGDLALREVELAYPDGGRYAAGDDAELTMVVANGGDSPDQLVSITGDGFQSYRVSGMGGAAATGSPAATSGAATTTGAAPSGAASTTTSPTTASSTTASGIAGATGSPSSTAVSSSAGGAQTISIPAQGIVQLGRNAPHVFLEGLTGSLTPGQRVAVTFTFARAGSVTVQAVVATPSGVTTPTSSFNFTEPPDAATTSSAGQG